jgi:hypothetical protein
MQSSNISNFRNFAAMFCLALSAADTDAAQFVEISAEVQSTSWPAQGGETQQTVTTRCVVSTNTWMVDGDFLRNGTATFWFTGTNVIQYTFVTKSLDQEKTLWVPSQVGERLATVRVSDGGRPDGLGLWNVVWLAFCSGSYLKGPLSVALPIGVLQPGEYARNYRQTISAVDDELGLPRRVEVATPGKELVCRYEAEERTAVEGWSFPQRFKLVQYRATVNGTWKPYLSVVGRLTSAHVANEPKIPTDVLKQVQQ